MSTQPEPPPDGRRPFPFAGPWLIIFTDLMAVILAFFILQFAMTEIEAEKWMAARTAFNHYFKEPAENVLPGLVAAPGAATLTPRPALDLDYLASVMAVQIEATPELAGATAEVRTDRLVIALPTRLLFDRDGADLRPGAEEALFVLGGALGGVPNRLDVVGHTDPALPVDGPFVSNWELSLMRAMAVAAALRRAGYTPALRAFGRASAEFARLNPALPLAQRRRLAQRVDIIVRADGDGG